MCLFVLLTKILCVWIGKAAAPACIHRRNWPVPYFSQKKAWMDVDICWKWFNEVFFPSVKARTGRQVLLILDNAPGHFPPFERDGVRVVFFPPNCTAWKQPCDLGIIAALKKRYKFMHLKNVLSFYDLPEDLKQLKMLAGGNLRRGAAGVEFGNPAHLLDAANNIKLCWDAISPETIKNSFRKAEIITLDDRLVAEVDEDDVETEDELENYVICDDEDSPLYYDEVMDDVNNIDVFQHDETDNNTEYVNNNKSDEDTETEGEEESSSFISFRSFYEKFLEIKEQLKVEHFTTIGAEKNYDAVASQFGNLEKELRELTRMEINAKKNAALSQMTLHDFYVPN
jgi:DDE superfamily endonuclease